jgi:hypothetical protein
MAEPSAQMDFEFDSIQSQGTHFWFKNFLFERIGLGKKMAYSGSFERCFRNAQIQNRDTFTGILTAA